jgi:hypothetical protein
LTGPVLAAHTLAMQADDANRKGDKATADTLAHKATAELLTLPVPGKEG